MTNFSKKKIIIFQRKTTEISTIDDKSVKKKKIVGDNNS